MIGIQNLNAQIDKFTSGIPSFKNNPRNHRILSVVVECGLVGGIATAVGCLAGLSIGLAIGSIGVILIAKKFFSQPLSLKDMMAFINKREVVYHAYFIDAYINSKKIPHGHIEHAELFYEISFEGKVIYGNYEIDKSKDSATNEKIFQDILAEKSKNPLQAKTLNSKMTCTLVLKQSDGFYACPTVSVENKKLLLGFDTGCLQTSPQQNTLEDINKHLKQYFPEMKK